MHGVMACRQTYYVQLAPPSWPAPFWYMKTTAKQEDANIMLQPTQLDFDGGQISHAQSTRPIKAGEWLVLYKPEVKKKATPLKPLSEQPVRRQPKKARVS